ncbi:hypothetical protein JB92DRAFT_2836786 [Gautieria morchelliformis]|nr:hypothetical protein JB92DRAFT_2836786 [Gautieria morchelliformis]
MTHVSSSSSLSLATARILGSPKHVVSISVWQLSHPQRIRLAFRSWVKLLPLGLLCPYSIQLEDVSAERILWVASANSLATISIFPYLWMEASLDEKGTFPFVSRRTRSTVLSKSKNELSFAAGSAGHSRTRISHSIVEILKLKSELEGMYEVINELADALSYRFPGLVIVLVNEEGKDVVFPLHLGALDWIKKRDDVVAVSLGNLK